MIGRPLELFEHVQAKKTRSMYFAPLTSVERLEALKPDFGIYAVAAEELVKEERITIVYSPDDTLPEGAAHVTVSGVNRRVAEKIARELAQRVKTPSAAVTSLAADRSDDQA